MQVTNTTHLFTQYPQRNTSRISKREVIGSPTRPRLRKVLVQRKPHKSVLQTLVKNNNNRSEVDSKGSSESQTTQPKKLRVVVFQHRLTKSRNHTEYKSKTERYPTLTMSKLTLNSATFQTDRLPTLSMSKSTLTSMNDATKRPRRRKLKQLSNKNHQLSISELVTKTRLLITTTSTELFTRTYTYVVERVHNDQTELLESISSFTRVHTRTLPATLTITRT